MQAEVDQEQKQGRSHTEEFSSACRCVCSALRIVAETFEGGVFCPSSHSTERFLQTWIWTSPTLPMGIWGC